MRLIMAIFAVHLVLKIFIASSAVTFTLHYTLYRIPCDNVIYSETTQTEVTQTKMCDKFWPFINKFRSSTPNTNNGRWLGTSQTQTDCVAPMWSMFFFPQNCFFQNRKLAHRPPCYSRLSLEDCCSNRLFAIMYKLPSLFRSRYRVIAVIVHCHYLLKHIVHWAKYCRYIRKRDPHFS